MKTSRLAPVLLAAVLLPAAAFATHPLPLFSLTQRDASGVTLPAGGTTTGTSVQVTATSDSSTCCGNYYLDIEVRPVGQAFQNVATNVGTLNKDSGGHQYPWVTISNLAPGTYKWQARERTTTSGSWQYFNAGQAAFTIGGVQLSPSTLAFGNVRVNQASTATTIELTNNSTAAINVTSAAITGPFAIASGPTLPSSVAAGAKLTFTITATPPTTGAQTGTFTLASDAVNSPHTANLSVTGVEPNLVLNPVSVSFGEWGINSAGKTQTVTVQNTGGAALTISGGTTAAPFSVTGLANLVVAAGSSATFTVTYAPTAVGNHTGSVVITSDAPGSPHTLALDGNGVQPQLSLSAASLSFPDTVVGSTSVAQQVTATNIGTGTLTHTAPTISSGFTTTLTAGTIAQGANKAFNVAFAPTAPGPVSGTLSIPSNDAAGPHTITLSGTARAPALSVAPSTHAFGTVNLGTSQTTVLTLTNTGDAPLSVSQLSFTGTHASEYALVTPPTLPATVAANGGSLQLTVRFQPSGLGVRSALLNITSNKYPAGVATVSFTGSGHGAVASVTPTSVNFGATNVNVPVTRTVTVANSGSASLTVSAITFSGGNASDFTTTQALPVTVPAGSSTLVTLQFKPVAAGSRSSTATIVTSDAVNPSFSVALSGVGQTPNISVGPVALGFGQVRTGQTATQTVSIQNTGTGPLTVSGLMITGPDAIRFSYSGIATPMTLQPGTPAVTVSVSFKPVAVGAASASLSIVSDDPDTATVQVSLSGSGVAPNMSLSATSINFGAQVVGRTSAARTVEVSNTGTANLQVFSLALTGPGSVDFAITNPTAPFTVAPGQKRAISITLTPSAVAEATSRLQLQTDAPTPTAYVDLVGLGISEVFSVSPMSLDFGVVKANTVGDSFTVTLTNKAGDELPLAGAEITGASAGDFEVTFIPMPIAAGGTATAQVTYKPKSAGTHLAELHFSSTDTRIPSARVALTGSSVSRILEPSPSAFDYAQVPVGQTASQIFAIVNKTSKPINLISFTSTSTEFIPDGSALGTVEPGRAANLTVTFAPNAEHVAIGAVSIAIEGQQPGQAELTIAVSGTGIPGEEVKTGCSAVGGPFALWALIALGVPMVLRRRRMR